jgi:glycosyltransferase involved in cell wall biosynthesis
VVSGGNPLDLLDKTMNIVHLVASPFVGGPEQQMLGLARSLPADYRTVFLAFSNNGKSDALLNEARQLGFQTLTLRNDTPNYQAAAREVGRSLRHLGADVLCCHGYKPDIIGWRAARQVHVPVISISHGWTAANFKARVNEALDRFVLRFIDRVVCVSHAQAVKVRQAGVPDKRIVVIRNAIGSEAFAAPDPAYREEVRKLLPADCRHVVGAAGRLSPEKGFGDLVEAADQILKTNPAAAFILFGEGPLRQSLAEHIRIRGLSDRFILGGFRSDLGRLLPHFDLLVLPSFTEGLPVVVLEAFAAGVPVIATSVGGTPEVVLDQVNGYLVPPGQPNQLAALISLALQDDSARRAMGERGRERAREQFSFEAQSAQYQKLFEDVHDSPRRLPRSASANHHLARSSKEAS